MPRAKITLWNFACWPVQSSLRAVRYRHRYCAHKCNHLHLTHTHTRARANKSISQSSFLNIQNALNLANGSLRNKKLPVTQKYSFRETISLRFRWRPLIESEIINYRRFSSITKGQRYMSSDRRKGPPYPQSNLH